MLKLSSSYFIFSGVLMMNMIKETQANSWLKWIAERSSATPVFGEGGYCVKPFELNLETWEKTGPTGTSGSNKQWSPRWTTNYRIVNNLGWYEWNLHKENPSLNTSPKNFLEDSSGKHELKIGRFTKHQWKNQCTARYHDMSEEGTWGQDDTELRWSPVDLWEDGLAGCCDRCSSDVGCKSGLTCREGVCVGESASQGFARRVGHIGNFPFLKYHYAKDEFAKRAAIRARAAKELKKRKDEGLLDPAGQTLSEESLMKEFNI